MRITPELFPLLGLKVVLGRPLAPDDAIDANPDVAVIGHDLWQTRFGGTPDVLGKSFELRPGRTVTVVGVAAPGSDVPGNRIPFPIVWHAIRVSERAAPNLRFTVLARLKPGRPISAVNAEITARRPLTDPNSGANRPVDATLLLDHIVGDSQRVLWVFFGAVTCVLLIGVANLVSLQLVRNAGRERELAVRAALGASRWRLVRQLLVESLLLGVVGGAGGLLAASTAVGLVTSALPAGFPRADQIALDGAVWVFAALVSVLVGVTIGVIPALRSIQPGLMQRVNEGGGERDAEPPACPDSTRPDRIRDGGRARAPRRRRSPGQQLRPAHVRGRGHARTRPVGRARHAAHEIPLARRHRILVVSLAAPPGVAGR